MRRALILYYSQAGQTEKAVQHFARGLSSGLEVDFFPIQSRETFTFPWKMKDFFRAFPRCVQSRAAEAQPPAIEWKRYDLVILAYPVWFLSPALPMQGFLKSDQAEGLRNKPIITLATCRNLWLSAACWMRDQILARGGHFLGQISICEKTPMWASFVTTPRWMLTGRKDAFWFFPRAGLSDAEFMELEQRGTRIAKEWENPGPGDSKLPSVGSNLIRISLLMLDRIGHAVFLAWSWLILTLFPKAGLGQDFLLFFFRVNLIILIVGLAPGISFFEWCVGNRPSWIRRLGLHT